LPANPAKQLCNYIILKETQIALLKLHASQNSAMFWIKFSQALDHAVVQDCCAAYRHKEECGGGK
jgi:hypothetical protein